MMHRSPLIAAACAVMMAFSFAFAGCGTKKEDTGESPSEVQRVFQTGN